MLEEIIAFDPLSADVFLSTGDLAADMLTLPLNCSRNRHVLPYDRFTYLWLHFLVQAWESSLAPREVIVQVDVDSESATMTICVFF